MANPPTGQSKKPDPDATAHPPGVEGGTGDVEARRAANPDGVGRPNDPPKKVNREQENRDGNPAADEMGEG